MAPLLLLLSGCWLVQSAKDLQEAIDELSHPLVVQGWILGVEPPSDPALADAIVEAGFEIGTTVTVYLADVESSSEVDQGLSGQTVEILADRRVAAVEDELSPGLYSVGAEVGLGYPVGDVWAVRIPIEDADEPSTLAVALPPPPAAAVPERHEPNTDLVVDLTGMEYTGALLVVVDASGAVTYTNEPVDASDILAMTGNDEPLTEVVIPASAFPEPAAYVVGVAGLRTSERDDLVEVNPFLSALMAGQMVLSPVLTTSPVVAQVQIVGVEVPTDPTIEAALAASPDLSVGTTASVFLADAEAALVDMEQAGLPGGAVAVEGVAAVDDGTGSYTVDAGLTYLSGATWTVAATAPGEEPGSAPVSLPGPISAVVPELHTANQPLDLDLTGQPFDSAVVVVLDGAGVLLHSTEPTTADELLDLTQDPAPLGVVTLPGTAFPVAASPYVVGVVGFEHADPLGFVELNQEFSSALAGTMVLHGLATVP